MTTFNKTCSIHFRHILNDACGSGEGSEVSGCGIYEDLTSGFFWVGSEDITIDKDIANGIVTITIPQGGCLNHFGGYLRHGDFNYNAGLFSDGFAIKIDNSANGIEVVFDARFYNITAAGTVSPSNPLTLNSAASLSSQVHEYAGGITLLAFDDMRARASAGGYIFA